MKHAVTEGENPRNIKYELAKEIAERFHGKNASDLAMKNFIARFQKGQLPGEIPEIRLITEDKAYPIANLLKEASLTSSTSEALRMIQQGAVKLDGERIDDRGLLIPKGSTHVYQVGKRRVARVTVV